MATQRKIESLPLEETVGQLPEWLVVRDWVYEDIDPDLEFNPPDLSVILKPDECPLTIRIVTWKDSLGRIKHSIEDFWTSKTIHRDIRQLKCAKTWTMPFGKHRGKTIDQIPNDYLDWAENNLNDERLRLTIKGLRAPS
jgi:hypothetical protein